MAPGYKRYPSARHEREWGERGRSEKKRAREGPFSVLPVGTRRHPAVRCAVVGSACTGARVVAARVWLGASTGMGAARGLTMRATRVGMATDRKSTRLNSSH